MAKCISELKPEKTTDCALIIGSGASLDELPYIAISNLFQKSAYVIVMNDTWILPDIAYDFTINHHTVKDMPDWYIEKYQNHINENPWKHVHPVYDCNNPFRGITQYTGDFWQYNGYAVCETTNLYVDPLIYPDPSHLFVGGSILFDAIGLAHRLGCKNLFFMGVDGGKVNGNAYCEEYRKLWPQDEYYVVGHSHRTMASLLPFIEWAKPKGWTFTNLSQRMGNEWPISGENEKNAHTDRLSFRVIEHAPY